MNKGEYRSIHTSLLHDLGYQQLSVPAKLVFYTLKLQLGPSGIDTFYTAVLPEQTGLSTDEAEAAVAELEVGSWIVREQNVLWLRNGLKYDPKLSLNNKNHRKAIEEHLSSLPPLQIVSNFAGYYDLIYPLEDDDLEYHADGMGDAIPDQGEGKRDKGEQIIADTETRRQFEEFCDYFTEVTGRQVREHSQKRFSAYKARMKSWSDEEMRAAVAAANDDPYLIGDDPNNTNGKNYLTIDYILKPEKMEKWASGLKSKSSAPPKLPPLMEDLSSGDEPAEG